MSDPYSSCSLSFHGEDVIPSAPAKARFHVIPVPYEKTVSYGHGTANGPQAILEASCQLETYDGHSDPSELGIFTADPVDCSGDAVSALSNIRAMVAARLSFRGAIPVVLGGEHTISSAVIAAVVDRHGRGNVGVVHFDAHCDLRDTYDGTRWSHACVMRRVHETGVRIYQIGTRSYCTEERDYREKHGISYVDAETLHRAGLESVVLPPDFPKKIFISFDIDALDSAVMPATGTPCPGGLLWHQAMQLLERLTQERECVGFDVVEFAPIAGLHFADFAAAQLVYNMMGYVARGKTQTC
jgi:agmatinase